MITYHAGIDSYPDIANRPAPAVYGVGVCIAAGVPYLSDGLLSWTSFSASVSNADVIGKVLTGYVSGAGVVAATDTILQAFNKLNGNIAAKADPATGITGSFTTITSITVTNGIVTAIAGT